MDKWDRSLGFACVVEGKKNLRAADGRKPQNSPHLRHSIERFLEVIDYLREIDVSVFRLPSHFVPYATHPDYPKLRWDKQMAQAADELSLLREKLLEQDLRLSFHPSQFVLLNSPRADVTANSIEELRWQAAILDELGLDKRARVLIHAGGVYDNRDLARERLLQRAQNLPREILARLSLENDDISWNSEEVRGMCQEIGIPMIFDIHHHACLPSGRSWLDALRQALETWGETRAKIHFSSPRLQAEKGRPRLRSHADYIDPWVWDRFCRSCDRAGLAEFDVMLEAKKKDLALLELRQHRQNSQHRP